MSKKNVIRTVNIPTTTPTRPFTGASISAVCKMLSIPPVINRLSKEIKGYLKPFLEIDNILYNDNAGGSSFPKLIGFTNDLLDLTPSEKRQEVLANLKLHNTAHRISKLNALKYDKGGYIDKTVKRYGNHTEQSRFVKVAAEAVELKLDLINEYEKWIDSEVNLYRIKEGDTGKMITEFKRVYDREVTPQKIESLQRDLLDLPSFEEKLKYLYALKAKYLTHLPPEILETSGTVFLPNVPAGTPLLFDRIIQIEIDRIIELKKLASNEGENGAALGASNSFDYTNKENYFFNDHLGRFKEIENEMCNREYIDQNGKWVAEKNKLVALVYILIRLTYLRPKISGKEANATTLAYRRFFEDRYNTDIREQMKPSKFKIGKLSSYKSDFLFIPEIDKI